MTELMKRYEAETGKQSAIVRFMCGGQALNQKSYPKLGLYDYGMEYIEWLEAQLTWRPVSEKPEKADWYLCKTKYADDFVGVETVFFNGKAFIYSRVIEWLPIPPASEGE